MVFVMQIHIKKPATLMDQIVSHHVHILTKLEIMNAMMKTMLACATLMEVTVAEQIGMEM